MNAGKVWYVGAGPGNPDLISVWGQELLRLADVIIHDNGLSAEFLDECRATARIIDTEQHGRVSPADVTSVAELIIREVRAGSNVVRLKLGDPLFFSCALHEIDALVTARIPFEIVPGIASPHAAASHAGVPLTDAQGQSSIAFFLGSDLLGGVINQAAIGRLGIAADTLCVLLAIAELRTVVATILGSGRAGQTPSVLVHQASMPNQRVLEAPLDQLVRLFEDDPISEPALLIVGNVTQWRHKMRWFEKRPLFGKRLLLCRPRHQAKESARAIRRFGAEPTILPLIAIEPIASNSRLAECVHRLSDYDWVILTSANGADQLCLAIGAAGLDARAFGHAKIAVIGPGTAKPLEKWGIKPDLIAIDHVAEGLARQLIAAGQAKKALLVRALEARDALPKALEAAGLDVEIIAAYGTQKLAAEQQQALRQLLKTRSVDVVLLTSSSMAEALVMALSPDAAICLSNICVASIGPITTATLLKRGVPVDVTAETYTIEGLLAALETHFLREHTPA